MEYDPKSAVSALHEHSYLYHDLCHRQIRHFLKDQYLKSVVCICNQPSGPPPLTTVTTLCGFGVFCFVFLTMVFLAADYCSYFVIKLVGLPHLGLFIML